MTANAEVPGAGAAGGKEGWYQVIYKEMWQQYLHEDQTLERRNNTFLAVQAAMLIVLGGIVKALIDVNIWEVSVNATKLRAFPFGIVMVLFASLALKLVKDWEEVTVVAGNYAKLRTFTLVNIEELAGVTDMGGAAIEYNWRKKGESWDSLPSGEFTPFPRSALLNQAKISSAGRGAYNITLSNAATIRWAWLSIFLSGGAIMFWRFV